MAWPASDFSARWRTDWESDMAALCLALNEREEALGRTQTVFKINTGGTTAKPTASQLAGMTLHKEFRDNLATLQTECEDLITDSAIEKWDTTLGGGVYWTHAALITSIGLGAFPATPDVNNGNDWERIREYLDALIYLHIQPTLSGYAYQEKSDSPTFTSDADVAWAELKAHSFTNETTSNASLIVMWDCQSGNPAILNTIWDNLAITYPTAKYSGSVSNGKLYYKYTTNNAYPGTISNLWNPVAFDIEGNTLTLDNGDDSADPSGTAYFSVTVDIVSDAVMNLSITTAEPAGSPFKSGANPDFGYIRVGAHILVFDLDLTSILTDQA